MIKMKLLTLRIEIFLAVIPSPSRKGEGKGKKLAQTTFLLYHLHAIKCVISMTWLFMRDSLNRETSVIECYFPKASFNSSQCHF